jgi:hypothetical protein
MNRYCGGFRNTCVTRSRFLSKSGYGDAVFIASGRVLPPLILWFMMLALSQLDELGICEAYMAGSLDVAGEMLSFVSLRGTLNGSYPLLNIVIPI